jgi:DnaJ-class molecular chaperone
MTKCEVCGGDGWYPIIDMHGCERYSIQCPECFGDGKADEEAIAAEKAEVAARNSAAIQRGKYEAAMAEKRDASREG